MAFCLTGYKKAKEILHKLTDPLERIFDGVLKVTGAIMNSAAWPLIQSLIESLPGGAAVSAYLIKGIIVLTQSNDVLHAKDGETAVKLFMEELKTLDPLHAHALLIKLASILTAAIHEAEIQAGLDEEVHKESVYDTLTQIKAVTNNYEAAKEAAKKAA